MTLAIGHFLYLNCLHCASSSPIMNYDCNRHNYHFHHCLHFHDCSAGLQLALDNVLGRE